MAVQVCEPVVDGTWQEWDDNGPYSALVSTAGDSNNASENNGAANLRLSVYVQVPVYLTVSSFVTIARLAKNDVTSNADVGVQTSNTVRNFTNQGVDIFTYGDFLDTWSSPNITYIVAGNGTTQCYCRKVTAASHLLMARLYATMTFVAPDGGFVFLLGLAGLMSLPLIGPIVDSSQFDKLLNWSEHVSPKHLILSAEEKVKAFDEYKAYRYPTYHFGINNG